MPEEHPSRCVWGTAPADTDLTDPRVVAGVEELILAAPAILGVDSAALLLRDRISALRLVSWSENIAAAVALSSPYLVADWPVRIDRGEAVAIDDLGVINEGGAGAREVNGARSMLWMPIVVGGCTVGALVAADRCAHSWHQEQKRAVQAYTSVLAVALNWSAQALSHEARGEQLVNHLGLDVDADPSMRKR